MLGDYISVNVLLGQPETANLFEYLAGQRAEGLLEASYVTSAPDCAGNIACVGIRVLKKGLLEEVAKNVRRLVPMLKVGVIR